MKKLFCLGNGFDLRHGLDTRYSDFKKYLIETYSYKYEGRYEVPSEGTVMGGDIGYSQDHVVSFILTVIDKVEGENWSNLEQSLGYLEFSEFIETEELDEFFSHDSLDEDDVNLFNLASNNEETASNIYFSVSQINELFEDWIATIEITDEVKADDNIIEMMCNGVNMFLNFNYTDTLQKVYGIDEVCHIHGSLDSELYFGHGSDKGVKASYSSSYVGALDSLEDLHSKLMKDTANALENNIAFFNGIDSSIKEVYSFGFSFSDVDLIYIQEICNNLVSKDVTWFLHSYDSGKNEEYKQKIRKCGFRGQFEQFDA